MPAQAWLDEHHAYLQLLLELADRGRADFDVVHNNSLHYLPVAMAPDGARADDHHVAHAADAVAGVRRAGGPVPGDLHRGQQPHVACLAGTLIPASRVIRNGVDLDRWQPGPGGGPALWLGRLVPEKGADLAIQAAAPAGQPLDLVGPIADRDYYAARVEPLLGGGVRYLGHLDPR